MTTTKLSRTEINLNTFQYLEGVVFPDSTILSNSKTSTKSIFGYGNVASSIDTAVTNLVSAYGNISTDTSGVGTARRLLSAASYGGDKSIFLHGIVNSGVNMTNLVSNLGNVSADISGVVNSKYWGAAADYGGDKAIFGFGINGTTGNITNVTNLISNIGTVIADSNGVGTGRRRLAAAGYGGDKAIFGFGTTSPPSGGSVSTTNLVSNTGVVLANVTNVGASARLGLAAVSYGGDRAVFSYGILFGNNIVNYVSNTGVLSSDYIVNSTVRDGLAAASYGGDKGIFGFGYTNNYSNVTNLISSIGVFASSLLGIGTARTGLAAASYS